MQPANLEWFVACDMVKRRRTLSASTVGVIAKNYCAEIRNINELDEPSRFDFAILSGSSSGSPGRKVEYRSASAPDKVPRNLRLSWDELAVTAKARLVDRNHAPA